MIGHLGTRVSALLDGQLSPADEERAWEHVHSCHQCRDAVEREGWVKTRLASMQLAGASSAPSHLKGSLMIAGIVGWPELADLADHPALAAHERRRHLGLAGIGSGAVGAAVMGVLALGTSPANAPGAVGGPTGGSIGSTLSHVITTVVDREPTSSTQDLNRRGTPPIGATAGRRLAP
ncbi:MAG: zf-HC2 domain-containing protein [Nocardioides sp.]